MHLSHLRVYDFRNFHELEEGFSKGINIFYGDNAQGKTNLLEAICFLINLRSPRAFREEQLIRYDRPKALVKGVFNTRSGDIERQIVISRDKKKVVKEGDIVKTRWQDMNNDIDVVYFSPEDLDLVKKDPAGRRRFLDMAIYQTRPNFYKYLKDYYKVLSQRNALLKDIKKSPSLKTTLDSWDIQLAKLGAALIRERLRVLSKISKFCVEFYTSFAPTGSRLEISYKSSINYENTESLEEDFLKSIKAKRDKDLNRCYTTTGPHRDDLIFLVDGKDAKYFASQGQQRLITLCLKFSQREILNIEKGNYPILLLDDVMSELDLKKRRLILEGEDNQVFITTTDLNLIPKDILQKSLVFSVKAGVLR